MPDMKPGFSLSDISALTAAYISHLTSAAPGWREFDKRALDLPDWYDRNLDPTSPAYLHQQLRLWEGIVSRGEEYDPSVHEISPADPLIDPVLFPGWYSNRSPGAIGLAADHFIALGQIMKVSGLQAGGARSSSTALGMGRSPLH